MSASTTPRRTRGGIITAALIAAALLISGCSGTASPSTTPDGNGSTPAPAAPDAVAYAQCMRDNGVPGFPDPDSNGEFAIDANELGVSPDSEQYQQAEQTCAPLMPVRSEDQRQADYQARLEYAKCMREQGLAGFPDPPVPGSGANTQENQSGGTQDGQGFDPDSAQFQAAHDACAHLLPEGDEGPSLSGQP